MPIAGRSFVRFFFRSTLALVMGQFLMPYAAGAGVTGVTGAVNEQPCLLATRTAIQNAVGMTPEYVSPPQRMGKDSCAWHTTNPNCFVRSLAIRIVREVGAMRTIEAASSQTSPASRPRSFAQGSFFRSDVLPPGSAIMVDHLYVKRATTWIDYSLSGRLGDDGSRALLELVASSSPKSA